MGAYEFFEQERRLEVRAASRFSMRTLADLTGRTAPQGILNQLSKMVWREARALLEDGVKEPSLRLVESEIVPAVLRKITMLGPKSKTAQFAAKHPGEMAEAVASLAERVMALLKVSTGCFFEIPFAIATIRYELDRELYGLVVPAIKTAMERLQNVDDATVLEVLRDEFGRVLQERIEARMWTLASVESEERRAAQ